MMFFLNQGYRVIAHDRRGHGRSSQTATGNRDGHLCGRRRRTHRHTGSEGRRAYRSLHRRRRSCALRRTCQKGRVAKAVLVSAVPPIMLKTENNPGGLPLEVFDGFRAALVANRAQFYVDVPAGPFYGFNRPGAKVYQGVIDNWWRRRA